MEITNLDCEGGSNAEANKTSLEVDCCLLRCREVRGEAVKKNIKGSMDVIITGGPKKCESCGVPKITVFETSNPQGREHCACLVKETK